MTTQRPLTHLVLAATLLAGVAACGSEDRSNDTAASPSASEAGAPLSEDPSDDPSESPPETADGSALPADLPGGSIAFRRFDEAQTSAAIHVISSDGTAERQVTEPAAGESDNLPDWSPDGTRIAFERQFEDKPYEVHVVDADGSDSHVVDPGCPAGRPKASICEETAPAWSPDGTRLLFGWPYGEVVNDFIEVFAVGVMDADGGRVEQLSNLMTPTTYEDSGPVWSPSGSQVAFIRENTTGKPVGAAAVFVMDADGGNEKQLTPWELRAADVAWAPDGTALSFRSEPDPGAEFVGDLYTVAADGSGLTEVTDHEDGTMTLGSSWSPDSQWIVFARSGVDDLPDLYVMRRDGSDLTPLTRTPVWDSAPSWSLVG